MLKNLMRAILMFKQGKKKKENPLKKQLESINKKTIWQT